MDVFLRLVEVGVVHSIREERCFDIAEDAVEDVEETGKEAARKLVEKNRNEAGIANVVSQAMQAEDGWTGAAEQR